ncbi:putative mediator of RNA polymerase II transcription subunit 26 [Papaver somniferum]|uniref:putative mediator of RNA polymerase II transcription subunit 26 n=1 Tax=Papaver somniferum TaxID=3469 RepID=UPI000E7053AD|nr:putative mediator of RNA polymerase II transcription subunit 26 [Papaver somniferum]
MASMNYSNITTTRRSTRRAQLRGATRQSLSSKNQYKNNVKQNLREQELQFLQQQLLEYKLQQQQQQEFERQKLLIQQKKSQEDYLLQLKVKKIQQDYFLQQELQKQLQKQQLYTKFPAGDPYSTYERKEWEDKEQTRIISDEQFAEDLRFILDSGMFDQEDKELEEQTRILDQEERNIYAKLTSFLYSSRKNPETNKSSTSSSISSSYCEPLFMKLGFESFFEKQVLDFTSCPINQKRNVRRVDEPRVARSRFY